MIEQGYGRIVNVASGIVAELGQVGHLDQQRGRGLAGGPLRRELANIT